MKYPSLDLGTIEAMVNKLGGMEGVQSFLRGDLVIQPPIDVLRIMEEIAISIPALPQPTLEELQAKYSWIARIEADTSPVEAVRLALGTVLRTGESSINGKKYEDRRAAIVGRMLGYQHLAWLVEHQDEFPAFMALLGKIYLDAPGLTVVNAVGSRYFPCLDQDGKRWYLDWYWTECDLDSFGRLAVSSK